jgi:hypothetical protein
VGGQCRFEANCDGEFGSRLGSQQTRESDRRGSGGMFSLIFSYLDDQRHVIINILF